MKKQYAHLKVILSMLFVLALILKCQIGWAKQEATDRKPTKRIEVVYLDSDKVIPNCAERKLNNKIILIVSRYCPHCQKAIKTLNPLITQYNLTNYFKVYDLIDSDDLDAIANDYQLNVPHVPTFIVGCKAYVGLSEPEEYKEYLQHFAAKLKTNISKHKAGEK